VVTAAEDGGELRGWPDGTVRIEEPLTERVESSAAPKHEVVAVLHLREQQVVPRLAAPFSRGEEGRERVDHDLIGFGPPEIALHDLIAPLAVG
jgi:hypothetical protein